MCAFGAGYPALRRVSREELPLKLTLRTGGLRPANRVHFLCVDKETRTAILNFIPIATLSE
jgi:hypothetical protein